MVSMVTKVGAKLSVAGVPVFLWKATVSPWARGFLSNLNILKWNWVTKSSS